MRRIIGRRVGAPISWGRLARRAVLLAICAFVIATGFRIYYRRLYLFLPDYMRWLEASVTAAAPERRPRHVFLVFTDHFEPDYDVERVERWAARYRALAARHRDASGRPPQHTWFYPGEQTTSPILEALRGMTSEGLGEVELHLHHEYDTADTLRIALRDAIEEFQRFGFLKTVDGETRFAFIHGNSGLDNSNGTLMCGVNEELRLLKELGCFVDYTFPSVWLNSQPPFVNAIYAAHDDPEPKSYAKALPLTALNDGRADLMIFEGALLFVPTWNPRQLFLRLEDSDVHPGSPPTPERVDRWIRANVHVDARPDWVFIKISSHSATSDEDEDATLGGEAEEGLTYLERRYNNGRDYVLHYVTAREAYNLARAAANGATGDPGQYLDAYIKPYLANLPR